MNKRWHPFVVGGKGTADEALNGLADDWEKTFKQKASEYRSRSSGSATLAGEPAAPSLARAARRTEAVA